MQQTDYNCPINMDTDTNARLTQHDVQLAKIETTLQNMATSLESLSRSMEKQSDLIMQLVHNESNFKSSVERIHQRIDNLNNDFTLLEARCNDFKKSLASVTFFVRNPKVALFSVIGLYVMTFKEVRDAVFRTLGG